MGNAPPHYLRHPRPQSSGWPDEGFRLGVKEHRSYSWPLDKMLFKIFFFFFLAVHVEVPGQGTEPEPQQQPKPLK